MTEAVASATEFYGGLSCQLDDLQKVLRELDARIADLSITAHSAFVDLVCDLDPSFLLAALQATVDCRNCIEKVERAKAEIEALDNEKLQGD